MSFDIDAFLVDNKIELEILEFIEEKNRYYNLENSIIIACILKIKLFEKKSIYSEVNELICDFVGKEANMSENRMNDVSAKHFDYLQLVDSLNMLLGVKLQELRDKYSLNSWESLIKENQSVINSSNDIFALSPMLISFEVWKIFVEFELSLIKPQIRIYEIRKMILCLKELSYRIGKDEIINISNHIYELPLGEFGEEEIIYFFDGDVFEVDINIFISYLQSIKLENLEFKEEKEIIKRIKGIVINNRVEKKIPFNKNYGLKDILKFFEYLNIANETTINAKSFLLAFSDLNHSVETNSLMFQNQNKIPKSDFDTFLKLIRYFKMKGVIVKFSDRKISKIIKEYYTKVQLSTESIRKYISENSNQDFEREKRNSLNYFLKE